jgi:ABC-2 type transport system permease protein
MRYGSRDVLTGVDFSVRRGEVITLLGPNGAGKVLALGLLATLPWGAVIGSLVRSPNSAFGLAMLPSLGLAAISGIFYPITALPGWAQTVAQAFPIYWLGLGIHSALLSDAAASSTCSGSEP